MAEKSRANLVVTDLTGEHERRGAIGRLLLEMRPSLDQVEGDLLEMRCEGDVTDIACARLS